MFPFPEDLYFHREHVWVRRESETLYRIGVDELFLKGIGPIAHLDLPTEGDEVSQDEACGLIRGQSIRKMLYAPLSGEIVDINQDLHEDPSILLEDPYGVGWIFLIDPSEPEEELDNLLHGEDAMDWWEREVELRRPPASPSSNE
jgi:glycine cleavage system H protein